MERDGGSRDRTSAPAAAVQIAVCVSGQGSNLVALLQAERRGRLGARVALVVADRDCPALGHAARAGVATAIVRRADHPDAAAWDRALAATLRDAGIGVVVLAGFMRVVGPATLAAFPGRMLNVHPALLPAFPGAHAVRDALAAGVRQTGVTVHLVDAVLDGGPIVLQVPVPVLPDDDEDRLLTRVHAVEHRLLPQAVALAAAGALTVEGKRVRVDASIAAGLPAPRRALLSVSDKSGLVDFGRALDSLGFELVSTGGTARALRDAGLDVTDVSAVTGFPEMLDGRVKTLHPRIEAGVLADLRLEAHRRQLAAAGIEPFQLVVVNLYPFAAAAATPGIGTDELIEQIDIGGPTLVRAAAKNHASVAVVTDPAAYPAIVEELRASGGLGEGTRRRLAVAAFGHTAAYDARIAAELPARLGVDIAPAVEAPESKAPAPGTGPASLPERIDLVFERVQALRYGENPHQAAALYRWPGTPPDTGPFAGGVDLRQGKPLSYNNLLDAAAAAGLARDLRGPACVIVKHTNPCGAAEADDMQTAWERALAGDPVSAYGGVVAVTRAVDAALAGRLTSLFLEVVVAPGVAPDALPILARKPNLRVVVDPFLGHPPGAAGVELRSAGGGVLATESDTRPDDPSTWRVATAREPTAAERRDLDLAWRIARHVKSNAIVLVRDAMLVGCGAGQQSRVDSARLAIAKAGPDRASGAACASDAFFPFADGVLACLEGGVTAFVQPGGSVRDEEVIAAADKAGATMLLTGRRHFRH